MVNNYWKCVGGEGKGGILVRQGKETTSVAEASRLSTGAEVLELRLEDGRLNYQLEKGEGPFTGWVSIKLAAKNLMERLDNNGVKDPVNATPVFVAPSNEFENSAEWWKNTLWSGPVEPFKPFAETVFENIPKPMPKPTKRLTPKQLAAVSADNKPGEFWGMQFPHDPEQIEAWGPAWFTKAMHKAGTFPKDVTVTKFTSFRVLAGDTAHQTDNEDDASWGGAGMKVMLDVELSKPTEGIATGFFIKIPHRCGNNSERHKVSCILDNDFPEVMFNNMLTRGVMPFRTPKCYFADMNRETTNFIVICEKIMYGDKGKCFEDFKPYEILPAPGKYQDFTLYNNGIDYYYAQTRAFARMAAWYQKSRTLSNQLDFMFAYKELAQHLIGEHNEMMKHVGQIADRMNSIAYFAKHMGQKGFMESTAGSMPLAPDTAKMFIELGLEYMSWAHVMLPKECLTPEFKKRFKHEAEELCKYAGVINFVITKCLPELNVLVHPNLQIDNAFYWKNEDGKIEAGLLDWGSVYHANVINAVASNWHAGELEVMDEHEDKLCDFLVDELLAAGGECCGKDMFRMLQRLARGVQCPGFFANISKLLQVLPKARWKEVTGRKDPLIQRLFLARCYGTSPMQMIYSFVKRSPYPDLLKLKEVLNLPQL